MQGQGAIQPVKTEADFCYLEAFDELDDASNPEQAQQLLDAQQLVYLHVTDYL